MINPEWNFETDIPVAENGPNNMKIEVFDSDKIGKDKSLGSANIDVKDLVHEPLQEAWIPLSGTKSGKIKVSADFDPEDEYGIDRGPGGQEIRKTSDTFSHSSYSRKTSEMSETHSSYSRSTVSGIAVDQELFGVLCKFCPTFPAFLTGTTKEGMKNRVLIAELPTLPKEAGIVFVSKMSGEWSTYSSSTYNIVQPVITELSYRSIRDENRIPLSHIRLAIARCQVACGMTNQTIFSRQHKIKKIKVDISDLWWP